MENQLRDKMDDSPNVHVIQTLERKTVQDALKLLNRLIHAGCLRKSPVFPSVKLLS